MICQEADRSRGLCTSSTGGANWNNVVQRDSILVFSVSYGNDRLTGKGCPDTGASLRMQRLFQRGAQCLKGKWLSDKSAGAQRPGLYNGFGI